jgi:putative membrane protein
MTVLCLAGTSAMAQNAAIPTDAQIARFAYTAGRADLAAADLALRTTHHAAVRSLAGRIMHNSTAVNQKSLALLAKLKGELENSDIGQALAGAAAEKRQELSKLSGDAFDKAYAKNELAYWLTVVGVLETTLIPSAQDPELKRLLEAGLELFKEHQKRAQQLVMELQ